MLEHGEQIGDKMLHAMKTTNEKNQMYHQQHAREPRMQHMHPLSPAGGTLMQEGGAHFASARETKRGTPGTGVAKPRQRASVGGSAVDWAPLAQSKRVYPDETKDDPFAVFPFPAIPCKALWLCLIKHSAIEMCVQICDVFVTCRNFRRPSQKRRQKSHLLSRQMLGWTNAMFCVRRIWRPSKDRSRRWKIRPKLLQMARSQTTSSRC